MSEIQNVKRDLAALANTLAATIEKNDATQTRLALAVLVTVLFTILLVVI